MPWPLVFYLATWVAVEWGPVWVAAAGGAGVGLTGLLGWVATRRRESGSVESSDAGTVFGAYDRAFERVEREVLRVSEDNAKLRERLAVVEAENAELRPYKDRVAVLETEVERLRGIVNGH